MNTCLYIKAFVTLGFKIKFKCQHFYILINKTGFYQQNISRLKKSYFSLYEGMKYLSQLIVRLGLTINK